ncbi:MAG: tetratricopeptide repeat protein [Actinomycetota bacterium]
MLTDRYGLELSTTSTEARDAYVEGVDRMLAADPNVEEQLDAAIAADPGFALAHAALGRQHQLLMRGRAARESVQLAADLAADATPREQGHVEILHHVLHGKIPQSLELTHAHMADHPRDAFALAPATGVFGSIGFSGRVDREPELRALLDPLATHYGDDWWFQTVHAFALLETGEWRRGRELAERSLAQRPTNSHGAHTLAHALFEAGADDEAQAFMGQWLTGSDRGSLMYCHNWWHYTLLLLNAGDHDGALVAFRDNCLPGTSESPAINVFTDSVSFLWQLELAGAPRNTDLWQEVRTFYEANFRRPIVFVDAHIGLVYAALGDADALDACIAELETLGEEGSLPAGTTAARLTQAYKAFANEHWADAIERFEPVMEQVVRIGGSRAQRNLQSNTLLAAYLNNGSGDDAAELLAREGDRQPGRPVVGLAG